MTARSRRGLVIGAFMVALLCAGRILWMMSAHTARPDVSAVTPQAAAYKSDEVAGEDPASHAAVLDGLVRDQVASADPRAVSPEAKRIADLVGEVGGESVDEMISHLNRESGFMSGFLSGDRIFVQMDIDCVMSNRRYLRLVSVLSDTSRVDAQAHCREAFARMFASHKSNMETILRMWERPNELAPERQSMTANKWGLCCAIALSARFCGTAVAVEQIRSVEGYEAAFEARLSGITMPSKAKLAAQSFHFIDSRFILNVLLSSAVEDQAMDASRKAQLAVFAQQCSKEKVILTAWNSAVSPYDLSHVRDGVPIDYSKGAREVTLYDWPDRISLDFAAQKVEARRLLEIISRP